MAAAGFGAVVGSILGSDRDGKTVIPSLAEMASLTLLAQWKATKHGDALSGQF